MKLLFIIVLLLSHSLTRAGEQNENELGRSLANYEICSKVATEINDQKMHFYYQKMFNDIGLSILNFDANSAQQVYAAWEKSEKVLLKINRDNLNKICLSRFDLLSRQMVDKQPRINL